MPRELQGNKNVNPSQVIIEREILRMGFKKTTKPQQLCQKISVYQINQIKKKGLVSKTRLQITKNMSKIKAELLFKYRIVLHTIVVCKTNVETHRTTSKKDVVNKQNWFIRNHAFQTMAKNTTLQKWRISVKRNPFQKTKLPDIQAK